MARRDPNKARTIKCASCGYPYVTKRANTKRCRVCQLIQRITWLGNRTTECAVTPEHHFIALDGHDKYCGRHDLIPRTLDATGVCRRCGEHSERLVHESIAICRACITDPANREWTLGKLHQKQAWQQDNAEGAWNGVHSEV